MANMNESAHNKTLDDVEIKATSRMKNPLAYRQYFITDINSRGDPQINWKFEIGIIPSLDLANALSFEEPFFEIQRLFTVHAREVEMPGTNFSVLKNKFLTWETVMPNRPQWKGEVEILFTERQTLPILKFFRLWQENIFQTIKPVDRNSPYNFFPTFLIKQQRTATIQVTMLHTDGQRSSVSGYYMNAWPKSISSTKLDMKAEGMVEYRVTFAYDYHKIASADAVQNWNAEIYTDG